MMKRLAAFTLGLLEVLPAAKPPHTSSQSHRIKDKDGKDITFSCRQPEGKTHGKPPIGFRIKRFQKIEEFQNTKHFLVEESVLQIVFFKFTIS